MPGVKRQAIFLLNAVPCAKLSPRRNHAEVLPLEIALCMLSLDNYSAQIRLGVQP